MLQFFLLCDIIALLIKSVFSSTWIEYQIPILAVVGSSPVRRAIGKRLYFKEYSLFHCCEILLKSYETALHLTLHLTLYFFTRISPTV